VLSHLSTLSSAISHFILSDSTPSHPSLNELQTYNDEVQQQKNKIDDDDKEKEKGTASGGGDEDDANLSESSLEARAALRTMIQWVKLIAARFQTSCPPPVYNLDANIITVEQEEHDSSVDYSSRLDALVSVTTICEPWSLTAAQTKRSDWGRLAAPILVNMLKELAGGAHTLKGTAAGIGLCCFASASALSFAMVLNSVCDMFKLSVKSNQNVSNLKVQEEEMEGIWSRDDRGNLELLGRLLLLTTTTSSSSTSTVNLSAVGCHADAVYPHLSSLIHYAHQHVARATRELMHESNKNIRSGSGSSEERNGIVQVRVLIDI